MVKFFTAFQFHADHSDYTVKRDSLSRRFQNLGGDQQGFNNLLENIRDWVKLKKHHILLEDIRRAAQWTVLEDIYQGFNIPDSYVLPDNDFYQNFKTRLLHTKERLTVLTGAPGVGKSTLLSYLKQELKKDDDIPVIRHHYYLSQDDTTGDRYSWAVVSQSLMGQIKENHSRILGDLCNKNPNPKEFRSWRSEERRVGKEC